MLDAHFGTPLWRWTPRVGRLVVDIVWLKIEVQRRHSKGYYPKGYELAVHMWKLPRT